MSETGWYTLAVYCDNDECPNNSLRIFRFEASERSVARSEARAKGWTFFDFGGCRCRECALEPPAGSE